MMYTFQVQAYSYALLLKHSTSHAAKLQPHARSRQLITSFLLLCHAVVVRVGCDVQVGGNARCPVQQPRRHSS